MLEALESAGVVLSRAFVLHLTPEQGEDFYTVLGGPDLIVSIEVDRCTGEVLQLQRQSVSAYRHSLKQMDRIRLAVALDLHHNGVPTSQ